MATTDMAALIPAFMIGGGAGALFFGGLWWTVSRGLASASPGLWFMASFVARTAVVALTILLTAQGRPDRFAACLLGLFCSRAIIVRRLRPLLTSVGGPDYAFKEKSQGL